MIAEKKYLGNSSYLITKMYTVCTCIPFNSYYTPPHNIGGVLWFQVGCPCVFSFKHFIQNFSLCTDITMNTVQTFRIESNGFSPNWYVH